ncbi:MAG: hypothetical protein RMK18_07725 [Armatimonadota bacterium]|nr:hypothetical protein [Armatimonadota bacterium]MCX7776653.1 hypothetical protein [Armatimonadota bacterium]MDW8025732.1 hypothetical protein [Armatimonadota bacterium]
MCVANGLFNLCFSFLMFASSPISYSNGLVFSTAVSEADLDYENTCELPPHPWRADKSKSGYSAPTKERLIGLFHIRGPIPPHSSWETAPTRDLVRHFRIAFKRQIQVGTLIGFIGNCEVSYLKPEVNPPGDPNNESHWVKVSEPSPRRSFRAVTFPKDILTSAIRLTFRLPKPPIQPEPSVIYGLAILRERLYDWAQWSTPIAESYIRRTAVEAERHSPWSLIDGDVNTDWRSAREEPITEKSPSWVILHWEQPKRISGVWLVNVFGKRVAIDTFTGKRVVNPALANESMWKQSAIVDVPIWWRPPYTDMGIKFPASVETLALRVRIIEPLTGENPDIAYVTQGGKLTNIARIGEVLALEDIGGRSLPAPPTPQKLTPPVPIRYTLPSDSYVTIAINDAQGRRVRNLIAHAFRHRGANVDWWDGTDDSGRLVAPGEYNAVFVRRGELNLRYHFTVYWSGKTPWLLQDGTGGWLSDHCPPRSVAIVGDKVFIGAFTAESGDTLMALDVNGNKLWGTKWLDLGGAALLCSNGEKLYVASKGAWLGFQGLQAVISELDPQTYRFRRLMQLKEDHGIEGIAAHREVLFVSYRNRDEIVAYDIAKLSQPANEPEKAILRTYNVHSPSAIWFDKRVNVLLAISSGRVVRVDLNSGEIKPLITDDLDEPQSIFVSEGGEIFISDRGHSHQVKVFSPNGKLLRVIGDAGGRNVGPYNPRRMSNPYGIAVDNAGRLWVAEEDYQPKRISVWDAREGKLLREFIGGPEYGGGPVWLSRDKRSAYYKGMEFELDFDNGAWKLKRIYYRVGDEAHGHIFPVTPDRPIEFKGRKFLVYDFGVHTGYVLITEDTGVYAKPLSAFGSCEWATGGAGRNPYAAGSKLLGNDFFNALGDRDPFKFNFVWADENGDGRLQANEVAFQDAPRADGEVARLFVYWGSLMSSRDFSVAMEGAGRLWLIKVSGWTKAGAPVYDLNNASQIGPAPIKGIGCGPSTAVLQDGTVIYTGEPILGISGDGTVIWSYPNPWGGVHASHGAPSPAPGRVIGTLRIIGTANVPTLGEVFAIIGNKGEVYLFTCDGLLIATLFKDHRIAPWWNIFAEPRRGMPVNDITLQEECFGPTFNATADGRFYFVCGHHHASIVELEGLKSSHKFSVRLRLTPKDVLACEQFILRRAAMERAKEGTLKLLSVRKALKQLKVDAELNEWEEKQFENVTSDGEVRAKFALMWNEHSLYLAAMVNDKTPALNSAKDLRLLFKFGDCVDLQLGLMRTPESHPQEIVAGDVRILLSIFGGKPIAVIYRYRSAGTKTPEKFASPVRSVTVDQVETLTRSKVAVKPTAIGYNVEAEILWDEIWSNIKPPIAGTKMPIDFGVIFSTQAGDSVAERLYWANKLSGIVSDLPSEVEIKPQLWGWCEFLE